MNILVTGGAGFIGSHLVDSLIKAKHHVTIFDNLDKQVHGDKRLKPSYLNKKAKFIKGDIRDSAAIKKALRGQNVIYHLAAAVGVGQSMYQIKHYTEVNTLGSANILEAIVNSPEKIKKIIVASSMSLYGEGLYYCSQHKNTYPTLRSKPNKNWQISCPRCQKALKPLSTPESKPLQPTSIYAINKYDTEQMFLTVGKSYNIPTVAMRFFNVYGERQSLSNPYTGVAAILASAMLNNKAPIIFEDGEQSRDFIHVSDIVQALLIVLKNKKIKNIVFNVGTGRQTTINQLAKSIARELNYKGEFKITNKFRQGDIRHCYSDIKTIKKLGYKPKVSLQAGLKQYCKWVSSQQSLFKSDKALKELKTYGLTK